MTEAKKVISNYKSAFGEEMLGSLELSDIIVEAALSKKAREVVRMDMRTVSGIADYFVICTGDADQQVKAIVDEVRAKIKETTNEIPWRVEGYEQRQWILMDYVNVIFHAFNEEKRKFYNLERLWADAEVEHIVDEV